MDTGFTSSLTRPQLLNTGYSLVVFHPRVCHACFLEIFLNQHFIIFSFLLRSYSDDSNAPVVHQFNNRYLKTGTLIYESPLVVPLLSKKRMTHQQIIKNNQSLSLKGNILFLLASKHSLHYVTLIKHILIPRT